MESSINDSLSKAIKSWMSHTIDAFRPRLCCEIDSITFIDAVEMVYTVLGSWEVDLFLASYEKSNKSYCLLTDLLGAKETVAEALTDEGTLSIIDPSQLGGCLFDMTLNEDESEDFTFLAAAWGNHEESIELIKKMNESAEIFRGN